METDSGLLQAVGDLITWSLAILCVLAVLGLVEQVLLTWRADHPALPLPRTQFGWIVCAVNQPAQRGVYLVHRQWEQDYITCDALWDGRKWDVDGVVLWMPKEASRG